MIRARKACSSTFASASLIASHRTLMRLERRRDPLMRGPLARGDRLRSLERKCIGSNYAYKDGHAMATSCSFRYRIAHRLQDAPVGSGLGALTCGGGTGPGRPGLANAPRRVRWPPGPLRDARALRVPCRDGESVKAVHEGEGERGESVRGDHEGESVNARSWRRRRRRESERCGKMSRLWRM